MKVSKKSWHYGVYAWTFTWARSGSETIIVPVPKDGCAYMRRVLFAGLLIGLLHIAAVFVGAVFVLCLAVMATVVYVVEGILKFVICAKIPKRGVWEEYRQFFKSKGQEPWSYRKCKLWKIGSVPLHPLGITLSYLCVYYRAELMSFTYNSAQVTSSFFSGCWNGLKNPETLALLLISAVLFGTALAIKVTCRSSAVREWYKMARAYAKAKKQKICPTIELVDDEAPHEESP